MPKRTPEKPRALDPQAGQAAFNQLEARLRAIPADQVSLPNSDIQDAAIAALNLVDVARDPQRSANLEGDKRYFDPTDASKARTYAESIVQALRSSLGASAADRADLRNRAWTLMLELYNEVRAAGEFVFRNDPVELDFFLPLRQVVSPARPRKTDT